MMHHHLQRRAFLANAVAGMVWASVWPAGAQGASPGQDRGGPGLYPGDYRVAAPPVPAGDAVAVSSPLGRVVGIESRGIRYFRGIPYAQPPVGERRFRPPEPLKPWTGDRDATRNPPAAAQFGPVLEAPSLSEDCLYLNIWAPSRPGPHPVYVYVHGGGNVSGYALEHRVNGASFARDGVVCVNVGYRLGIMGFLELGELLGPDYAGSGNNGLKDIIAALEWVKASISAFGGDPANVTLGGQSAGAFNVISLVSSPAANGLFNRAISQSGSGHGISTQARAHSVAQNFAFQASEAGIEVGTLPSVAMDKLIALQAACLPVGSLNGFIDGSILPDHPYHCAQWLSNRSRSLLIGANRDEVAVLGGADPARFSPEERVAFRSYRASFADEPIGVAAVRFKSAMQFGLPSALFADAFARSHGRVFAYEWTWAPTSGRYAGAAFHGAEQPFAWDNPRSIAFRDVTPIPEHAVLARRVHQRWVNFICNGHPSPHAEVLWPRWQSTARQVLRIDTNDRAAASSIMAVPWYAGHIAI